MAVDALGKNAAEEAKKNAVVKNLSGAVKSAASIKKAVKGMADGVEM